MMGHNGWACSLGLVGGMCERKANWGCRKEATTTGNNPGVTMTTLDSASTNKFHWMRSQERFATGGPSWEVPLGRRDSLGASLSGSNYNIPAPNNTLPTIITKFKLKELDIVDLVALSGGHTIGDSRCTSFRQRLYNQTGNGLPDGTLDPNYAAQLRQRCPKSGGDQNLFGLDYVTPLKFDNFYFKNLIIMKGLLSSDEILFTRSSATMELVEKYAANNELFFEQFAKSMVKMGNITPLTGSNGEIRKNCRRINH